MVPEGVKRETERCTQQSQRRLEEACNHTITQSRWRSMRALGRALGMSPLSSWLASWHSLSDSVITPSLGWFGWDHRSPVAASAGSMQCC